MAYRTTFRLYGVSQKKWLAKKFFWDALYRRFGPFQCRSYTVWTLFSVVGEPSKSSPCPKLGLPHGITFTNLWCQDSWRLVIFIEEEKRRYCNYYMKIIQLISREKWTFLLSKLDICFFRKKFALEEDVKFWFMIIIFLLFREPKASKK